MYKYSNEFKLEVDKKFIYVIIESLTSNLSRSFL